VLTVGAVASGAHAEPAPVPTLISATANPGGSDDISGGGCAARVSVQFQFDGALLLTTRSTATGRYSAHLVIPVSAVPGSHRITVVCAGATGQTSNATSVTVLSGALPHTGIDESRLLTLGLLSVVGGTTLALTRRRSRAVRA
jgi:LPXTG-motif cell wall-anchored protein